VIPTAIAHYLPEALGQKVRQGPSAMTERQVFLDALDRKDPDERTAYLDAACAGRPELRRRVEELLRSHYEADTFLEVPAVEQMAEAEQSLAFLRPAEAPDSLGRLDHYEVLEVVGRGGMGVVLKARDTKLERVVAIKVLVPRLSASPDARQRFVREARAAAAVRDDHVVSIHAVGDDGPVPYLVMEYISGITLEERVRLAGALELREILRIGMQLAQGLAAAHAQGVTHRDIKPANVLLENSVQRVKITDFGLAGVADDGGTCGGTPLYMSPEQARGEPTDHRTDLFSLGGVLYTLCTGGPPFRADTTAAVLKRVLNDTPRPAGELNPAVPDWLGDLIDRLLAKKACDRPASARDVADLLTGRLALLQQPPQTQPAPGPSAWRGRLLLACLVVLLFGLAALAAVLKPWQHPLPKLGGATSRETARPAEPLDLRRDAIPPRLLALAGGGDPAQAPPELAAVLGDGRFLLPHAGGTAWMDQSPDGKLLAVPLVEDVVLFEAPTGECIRSLKGPGGNVVWVTFSRDSGLLAATTWHGGQGGAVRVWDLRADRELYTNPIPGPKVAGAAAFSPDGRRLVTEGDERLQVWDARLGREVQAVELHPGGVSSLCFSPDGRRLAVGLWQGKGVKVFDWDEEKLGAVRALEHRLSVGAVVYSPDGKFLASGDQNEFKLWTADTLEELCTIATPAQQLAFAPDSRTLYAAWTNEQPKAVHTFTRWDVVAQEELPPLSVGVSVERAYAHHCLSRDGKVLFVAPGSQANYVKAIDTATGKEFFPRPGHSAALNTVAVNPDGRTLASAGEDRAVKLWDLAAGRVLHTLSAHTDAVFGLAFSPDGNRLASGSRDGTIILWDVDSGAEWRRLKGHSGCSSRVQFSPDGRTLAAGGEDGAVKLWDAASGKPADPLPGHAGAVRCVAYSPEGKLLASGGEDKAVRLHDLAAGTSRKFTMPSAVNDVAFSPDGRTLAAVGDAPDFAVRLWDPETGQETTWAGHKGAVRGLTFSPAGPLLATCAEDDTVRLWNRSGSDPQARTIDLGAPPSGVRAVAFTPDGRYLVTANGNGTLYVLRVGPLP
jgi:WD40 repeat protein/tRNA A-37 threonylcarbamoyl transferase component Bud32